VGSGAALQVGQEAAAEDPHEILRVFAEHGLNMDKLESRPSRERAWEYVFWVDLDGDASSHTMATALRQLDAVTTRCRVLGSYPTASGD
jgi:chorismate mutase/prephenate dehydratase